MNNLHTGSNKVNFLSTISSMVRSMIRSTVSTVSTVSTQTVDYNLHNYV